MSEENKGKSSPKQGITARVGRYFRDMKGELKKVVWPSKKQVINNTIVVMITVVIASFFIGGFDMILSAILNLLFLRALKAFEIVSHKENDESAEG